MQQDDPFAPDTVDAYIDQVLSTAPPPEQHSPARLVHLLQRLYAADRRVCERLAGPMETRHPMGEPGEIRLAPVEPPQHPQSSPGVRVPQTK